MSSREVRIFRNRSRDSRMGSAALDERVHECGVLGSSLAADVLVVLKAQLYRFHPLFAQVV